jgi:hypothetical protein
VILRRPAGSFVARILGIALLIPGLLRIPLPQIDYHNIRHHDGAGEICPHHDHLLRWHPRASQNEDVAVLHWHWLAPQTLQPNAPADRDHDGQRPSPPSLHAYLPDCVEPDWPSDPVVHSERRWGAHDLVSLLAGFDLAAHASSFGIAELSSTGPTAPHCAAPGLSEPGRLSLVERWNC